MPRVRLVFTLPLRRFLEAPAQDLEAASAREAANLNAPLSEGAEIHLLQALSGG